MAILFLKILSTMINVMYFCMRLYQTEKYFCRINSFLLVFHAWEQKDICGSTIKAIKSMFCGVKNLFDFSGEWSLVFDSFFSGDFRSVGCLEHLPPAICSLANDEYIDLYFFFAMLIRVY